MNSVRKSVRLLKDYGLSFNGSASPVPVTRTVKLKVDTATSPAFKRNLNGLFDAFEEYRIEVMGKLEDFWDDAPDSFIQMVKSSGSKPFEKKSSCYGWMRTKYLTGATLPEGLSLTAADALLNSLSGNLKSFLTRRKTVSDEIKKTVKNNALEYKKLSLIASDQDESNTLPPSPQKVDDSKLTKDSIKGYNDSVGLLRSWVNLILNQKHGMGRNDAPLPKYIKGYPGFPGSQRYNVQITVCESLKMLRDVLEERASEIAEVFKNASGEEWNQIRERFSWNLINEDPSLKPRNAKQIISHRLTWLEENNPNWTPVKFTKEIISGAFRSLDKITLHLEKCDYSDRQAIVKYQSLCNVCSVFSIEPLRIRGEYKDYYIKDTPRRNAFGEARGAMHQASDDTASIPISGFSLSGSSPQYGGMLAYRIEDENKHRWVFLYKRTGQNLKLLQPNKTVKPPKGYQKTDLTGFAKEGASDKAKILRGEVWVPTEEDKKPEELALHFGSRQGREYFWHFERGLASKDEWMLGGDARILRIMPPGNQLEANFFLTLTFTRQAPPPVNELPSSNLIGIDRGEKIPAAYAITNSKGKWLVDEKRYHDFNKQLQKWNDSFSSWFKNQRGNKPPLLHWEAKESDGFGVISPEYLSQQESFNYFKRELQQIKGGYTKTLRSKERNRAKALGGEVTRELLHLANEHKAPLVLEKLSGGISTRGGKGVIMSRMQYERILVGLEQRLAETGLYDLPTQPKFRKIDNRFLKLTRPHWTSLTCSKCGQVHANDYYESIALALEKKGVDWIVTLPDKSTRVLPKTYEYYSRSFGMKTRKVDERISEILGKKTAETLSATARKTLVSNLRSYWLPYRPTQASFQCVACGHQANADLQAALNIARKFIYEIETKSKGKGDSEKDRKSGMSKWEKWYKERVASNWL